MDTVREEAGLIPRILAAVANVGHRFPWTVLAATALSCGICLWYTGTNLTYETQRDDIHSKNQAYYQRWEQYVKEFGDDDDMVVVVQAKEAKTGIDSQLTTRERMTAALEELAGQIQKKPYLFDRLFYKVDLRPLRDRALLFLSADNIRLIQDNLQDLKLLLEVPVLGGIDPLFGWKSLNLIQLLHEGERHATALAGDRTLSPDKDSFFKQLNAICVTATAVLDNQAAYKNPWQSILPEQAQQQDMLAEPQFFFNEDGTLAFLMARPFKNGEGFTFAQKSIDGLRAIIAQTAPRFPGLDFGLTGLPILDNDEMVASQNDSSRAGWLALFGVSLLYLVVYRCLRYPFMTVVALLVGTAWALGWMTLTVGHLNILSSAFAVMLIGMGDYGVLWVTRYGEERRAGADLAEALRKTALYIGPSILTAAMAIALAFYAAMLADLKAVAELGWIAGSGVLFCALSCFVVMPPLLTVLDKRSKLKAKDEDPAILSLKQHRADHRPWLPGLSKKPRWVIAGSVLATLALAYFAFHIQYDHNLLKLQAQGLESVKWEQTLIDKTPGANWHALSYTTTPEEVIALKSCYEKLPAVSRVVEVASLVPRDQDRKLEQLKDIQNRLRRLPERNVLIPRAQPEPGDIQRTAGHLLGLLVALQDSPMAHTLTVNLRQLLDRLSAMNANVAGRRLQEFEQFLTRDLAENLYRLKDVSTAAPIKIADVPECLRERYISKNGKWLLRVFAKECLWDYEPLATFVSQVRTIDPDATGKPFTTLEGLRAMKNGFMRAGGYAFAAMVLMLLFNFGNVRHTLIALLPLGMGLAATLGFMVLGGCSINPANMIAIPLILGVGADNGVHVLHDYRNRGKGASYFLASSTGRGIMVKALTTIIGFGTLMIASHRGLASLGLFLTLGVTCCMMTALVFLPALLSLRRQGAVAQSTLELKKMAG